MKKNLILIGFMVILAIGAAIYMEEKAREETPFTNPIGDEEDIKKAAQEYQDQQKQANMRDSLSGSWTWQSSVDAQGETVTPADPDKFVITFTDDGRLSSTTDCNSLSGSFIKNEEVISVGPLVSTKKGCLEETLEMEYAAQLALASSHTIEGDTLKIILVKDAGVMTFVRK